MSRLFLMTSFMALTVFSGQAFAREAPVTRVTLSASGLAQFEHDAMASGNDQIDLHVRLDQVDDVLKSMVVFDPFGRVTSVTTPGREPLDQVFRDLPFNLGDLGRPADLLNRYQGASVTVRDGSKSITGKLVQVETETVALKDQQGTTQRHRISLMTPEGSLRQAVLEDLNAVEFNDATVRDEITRALGAVREHSTKDSRTLNIKLKGDSTRPVTMSYVVDAPLWKSAYRLVLPDAGKTSGLMQGWAVIENMTGSDWENVDLTLVSGNPVTYRQALYPSYHVTRPEIPVEVFGRIMPRMDTGAVAQAADLQKSRENRGAQMLEKKALMGMNAPAAEMAYADAAAPAMMMQGEMDTAGNMASPMPTSPSRGIGGIAAMSDAAQSAEATTQVLFKFKDRYSVRAGDSMMLPFVSRSVPMQRVSLYQPDTNGVHPLAAVQIKNDGETGLPPGILTLYEETPGAKATNFIGDAQFPVLAKGEDRFVPYALDSKTSIDREDKSNATEGKITISQGVMQTAYKTVNETLYTIKAPADEARTVIIEHPRQGGDWKLTAPEPKDVEATTTHYRVKAVLKPGETKTVTVSLEHSDWQSVEILNIDEGSLQLYASSRGDLDSDTRKIFVRLAELRRAVDEVSRQINTLDEQKNQIYNDQQRLRENIKSLVEKSDLKSRYMDQLDEQEDQLEDIGEQRQKLDIVQQERLTALQSYIAGIKVE